MSLHFDKVDPISKQKITLVLLPGLLSNYRVFQQQIEYLKENISVLVIELTDVDSPTAMAEKVLRCAPEQFMLAGHSIGGWVALKITQIAPQRVQKLCVLNTSAKGVDPAELVLRQHVLSRIKKGEFINIATEIANKFTFNESVKPSVLEMFLAVGEEALRNQTQAMMIREDLSQSLPKITCPTWVIHAEQDQRFSLDSLKEVAEGIPHAEFRIVNDCGHMSPMEQPLEIAQLLHQWINEKSA